MKNIYSNIYSFNKRVLQKTVKILKDAELVGLPTETVYGLAGNAYSKKALRKIFLLKKRPKKNPLILHYYNFKRASNDVVLNKDFYKLYKKFCPGPLTFVLKRKRTSKIDSYATANLDTVAVRFPSHKVVRSILRNLNFPLAMPSANISSRLSPVNAIDVYNEFKNKLKIIVNGGRSKIGIESTVIDLSKTPNLLRPGIIGLSEIKKIVKKVSTSSKNVKLKAPGMMKRHYSPGIPLVIGKKPKNLKDAFIVFGRKYKNKDNYFNLSKKGNLKEAASNLYTTMRKIKENGFKRIFVAKIPKQGPGIAINDRLKRASK